MLGAQPQAELFFCVKSHLSTVKSHSHVLVFSYSLLTKYTPSCIIRYICSMDSLFRKGWRSLIVALYIMLNGCIVWAQHKEEITDTIHLSPSFMKALEDAFSFEQKHDTIRYREEFLTRKQLREWVGDVDTTLYQPNVTYAEEGDSCRDTLRLDPRFIGMRPILPPTSIMFPNFAKEIELWKSKNGKYRVIKTTGTQQAVSGLDVKKALSELLIPSHRRIRKVRDLADKKRAEMDAAYPLWKE